MLGDGDAPFEQKSRAPGDLDDSAASFTVNERKRSAGCRSVRNAPLHLVVGECKVRPLNRSYARRIDERGGGLSGGERRRLGLARAILKRAPLLVLDEPTANLDPVSEHAILDVIRQAARGRTTLIATHSPAVAALADRVVTL